jgi:hypothetical protein
MDIVRLLVDAGANVRAVSEVGHTTHEY